MTDAIQFQPVIEALGQPAKLDQDPRKGLTAIWGTRETGCFTVFRGPIDETYEISLIPVFDSAWPGYIGGTMSGADLSDFVARNLAMIQAILRSE